MNERRGTRNAHTGAFYGSSYPMPVISRPIPTQPWGPWWARPVQLRPLVGC